MNINRKVFAIVNKATQEIVAFGLTKRSVSNDWEMYYEGTEAEETHELTETFVTEEYIKEQSTTK